MVAVLKYYESYINSFSYEEYVDEQGNGIEIWSVNEGQRKYDTHEDELVGWLGTWLASGESRKISLRVKASKATMSDRGLYSGGYVPYGFDAKRLGRVNKKDQPVRDLTINEDECFESLSPPPFEQQHQHGLF